MRSGPAVSSINRLDNGCSRPSGPTGDRRPSAHEPPRLDLSIRRSPSPRCALFRRSPEAEVPAIRGDEATNGRGAGWPGSSEPWGAASSFPTAGTGTPQRRTALQDAVRRDAPATASASPTASNADVGPSPRETTASAEARRSSDVPRILPPQHHSRLGGPGLRGHADRQLLRRLISPPGPSGRRSTGRPPRTPTPIAPAPPPDRQTATSDARHVSRYGVDARDRPDIPPPNHGGPATDTGSPPTGSPGNRPHRHACQASAHRTRRADR